MPGSRSIRYISPAEIRVSRISAEVYECLRRARILRHRGAIKGAADQELFALLELLNEASTTDFTSGRLDELIEAFPDDMRQVLERVKCELSSDTN